MVFIYGKEKFLVREKFFAIKSKFEKENKSAVIDEFDFAEDFNFNEFKVKSSSGGGLFAEKKLVIVKNILALNSVDQKKAQEFLKVFLKKESSEIIFIFVEMVNSPLKGGLYNFLKKNFESFKCETLKINELNNWIKVQIDKKTNGNLKVDNPVLSEISAIKKGNLWAISNEIEKIVNFKSSGKFTLDDLGKICQRKVEGKIFDLVDAVGMQNKERALMIKKHLQDQGENDFYIFSMIFFQLRNLVKAGNLFERGFRDSRALASKLKMNNFVAQKTISQIGRFPLKRAIKAYSLGVEIDFKVKQGSFDMKDELDYFLVSI